jgi:hypothetical protein
MQVGWMLATEMELFVDRLGLIDEFEHSPFTALTDLVKSTCINPS